MIRLSVRHDFIRFRDTLTDFQRTQLPFAAANALTAAAREVAKGQTDALDTALDKPTPFTKRAFGAIPARKNNLEAMIFAKDIQAAYLKLPETGGTRAPVKQAIVVPDKIRRNQYGNIPKGALARAKAQKRVFIGTIGKRSGIWERLGRGVAPRRLVAFEQQTKYRPQLGYRERLAPLVARSLPGLMQAAMEKAMRTARR